MDVRTFDEVVDDQGWSDQTLIILLRQCIAACGMHEELDQLAREQAFFENNGVQE